MLLIVRAAQTRMILWRLDPEIAATAAQPAFPTPSPHRIRVHQLLAEKYMRWMGEKGMIWRARPTTRGSAVAISGDALPCLTMRVGAQTRTN